MCVCVCVCARARACTSKNYVRGDFPGGPMVTTPCFHGGGWDSGSVSRQGTKIPHAMWPKNKNKDYGRLLAPCYGLQISPPASFKF